MAFPWPFHPTRASKPSGAQRYGPHFQGHNRGISGMVVAKNNANIPLFQGGSIPAYILAKYPTKERYLRRSYSFYCSALGA